jgi:hypothetical protein
MGRRLMKRAPGGRGGHATTRERGTLDPYEQALEAMCSELFEANALCTSMAFSSACFVSVAAERVEHLQYGGACCGRGSRRWGST